ncbi:branched-chain amino acid ABC transporter permease [Paralcaligenes ureilyticus]|uniref:Amino acid/amide ABC transporter membrane protein 1 (HAAT family) n=1 Tax=Paralcaligenes ureilyticus TaxID=627131 RepID=A0A4R3M7U8_9BURK|nr:branched-chain amino acid ABC transporter permease [Paralcaligenes ureilyticus]TCT09571.1 amino acid/amide ABC transporter membrane protein 1 (HAAT family) [Paralcaligenes ureilyticus]
MLVVSLILNGVVLGSILLLSSLGLTLIYGVGRIVNFAHGALFSLGAMSAVWFTALGLPFWLALLLALVVVGLLGIAMDWGLLARIRDRPMIDSLLLTFGIAMLITGALYESGGRNVQALVPPEILSGTFHLFGVALPVYRLFVTVLSILLTVALLIFLKKSKWGLRVRAANDNGEMAACLSINRDTLMHSVVGVSAALVAISGAAAAPIFNAYAIVGDKILILAFMTVILGGLGSLRGAIVAAYVVGLIIVFGEAYSGGQGGLLVLFLLVMAMLVRWPRGFFGEGRIE